MIMANFFTNEGKNAITNNKNVNFLKKKRILIENAQAN